MSKSDNQKARIFALYQIMKRYTDETHGLTMKEILLHLERDYDIVSTRQTIDSDFALLENPLGVEFDCTFEKPTRYYLTSRELTFEDILTLSESLQLNPFLSTNQKQQIIGAIKKNLCSIHEAKNLTLNTSVLAEESPFEDKELKNKLDLITQAVENQLFMIFHYPSFSVSKNKLIRTVNSYWVLPLYQYTYNNKPYVCCVEENTVMSQGLSFTGISNRKKSEVPLCFEVDKITDLTLGRKATAKTPIPDSDTIKSAIQSHNYSIYDSTNEKISMEFDADLLPIIYDYFGKDIKIEEVSESRLYLITNTEVSPEFFSWIFSLGTGVKLLSPLQVVQRMRRWIKSLSELYGVAESSE